MSTHGSVTTRVGFNRAEWAAQQCWSAAYDTIRYCVFNVQSKNDG